MEPMVIRYRFDVDDGTHAEFEVVLDPQTLELSDPGPALPAWTLLEFHQCPHCPLSPMEHVRCPAAAHLARLVQAFDHLPSHARAMVEVLTDQRTVIHETSVQQGVGALMGLLMATSGCPVTTFFRPMARFHLPFANQEETAFRAASTYLLADYYRRRGGGGSDDAFEGLARIYRDMHVLNLAMGDRLRAATRTDSSVNAVIVLDTFALTMPIEVEDQLPDLVEFFRPYLEREDEVGSPAARGEELRDQ